MASFSYLWMLVKKIAIKLQFIVSERFDIEEGARWVPLGGRNRVYGWTGSKEWWIQEDLLGERENGA